MCVLRGNIDITEERGMGCTQKYEKVACVCACIEYSVGKVACSLESMWECTDENRGRAEREEKGDNRLWG